MTYWVAIWILVTCAFFVGRAYQRLADQRNAVDRWLANRHPAIMPRGRDRP
jgi:hypothetical protein